MSVYTEEEAKTQWCPFIRFTDETGETYAITNRGDVCDRTRNQEARDLSRCIGPACMAWRWDVKPEHSVGSPIPLVHHVDGVGYCGLAGKP